MTVYVPYSQTAPQTTNLRELKLELDRVRAEYGPGSSQGYEAFQRLSREAGRQGRPLSGLRRFSANETERFFAQVIPGPDGHHYWDGGRRDFRRNDGRYRVPARYWWEREHGPIGSATLRLYPTCGGAACINPEHAELRHFSPRRYTDAQIIGAIQVWAMQNGRTPMRKEWKQLGLRPDAMIIIQRLSGGGANAWDSAMRVCGLEPPTRRIAVTKENCLRGIRLIARKTGRLPYLSDFDNPEIRAALNRSGLPQSKRSYQDRFASWVEARKEAGVTK